jgi:hypothetical protein
MTPEGIRLLQDLRRHLLEPSTQIRSHHADTPTEDPVGAVA